MPVLKKITHWKKQLVVLYFRTISPKTIRYSFSNNKNRYRSASLTAEAALVFPVFFFAVYLLWQLFLLVLFQTEVCNKITEAAIKNAHLGYSERQTEVQDVDISWLYQPLLWNALPRSDRVENLWVVCEPEEDGTIQVLVHYRFVCEALFFTKITIPIRQNFRFYPWLGRTDADLFPGADPEEEVDVVYMTEYGTVYHESRACGYLTVAVREVKASEVEEERNSFGKKYTLCERCDDKTTGQNVYISAGGTKYHWEASCPALKRTVTEKERKEVKDVPACHKCSGSKENKEE